jgi:2-octaprenyl-6-methoxyphenol hydroxylase
VTDGLTHLLGVKGQPARAIRRFGLGLVEKLPPLKHSFMNEARGAGGTLPKLLQGMTL